MSVYDQEGDGRNGGGFFNGRFITGLIIMLIGLFMYFNNSQENPVTHQKQHISLTPDQEIRLGLESAPSMTNEMGGELPLSDPRAQEVVKMGKWIVSKTVVANSPWQFKFHLLADDQTVNAFALPGGQIFITLGLFNQLQTEAQLAGVLSHEIGHVIERHSAQQMAKSDLGQMFVVGMGVGLGGADQNNSGEYSPMMIASVVNQMIQLHYSRHDESQADIWGLKLMEASGFNPYAMVEVMKILKKASGRGGNGVELFQTHPNPDLRIEQINDYLAVHPPKEGLKEGKELKSIFSNE